MDKLFEQLKETAHKLKAGTDINCSCSFCYETDSDSFYGVWVGGDNATGQTIEQAIGRLNGKIQQRADTLEKQAAAAGYKLVKLEAAQ